MNKLYSKHITSSCFGRREKRGATKLKRYAQERQTNLLEIIGNNFGH